MTKDANRLQELESRLVATLAAYRRVAVAFSGGVDSAVVSKAAAMGCGENAVAVTSVSPSLAAGELEEATRVAKQIGIAHRILRTTEFENPDYLKNAPNRCYFCKTELYSQIEKLLPELDVDVMANGANLDDRGDFRPGMKAAGEHRVRSPLIEAAFNKQDVRDLANYWDLPVWDKPATPCLSSRIAYGVEVTEERVARVDRAEAFLRKEFSLRELRVRHEANDLARIEVPVSEIPRLLEPTSRARVTEHLRSLGFRFVTVDLDGFRSGSMNEVIPLEMLISSTSSSHTSP